MLDSGCAFEWVHIPYPGWHSLRSFTPGYQYAAPMGLLKVRCLIVELWIVRLIHFQICSGSCGAQHGGVSIRDGGCAFGGVWLFSTPGGALPN